VRIVEMLMLLLTPYSLDYQHRSAVDYWNQCSLLYDMEERVYGCTMLLREGGLNPYDHSVVYMQRGIAYSELGDKTRANADFAEAIKGFDEILERDPNDIEVLWHRGVSHRASGNLARGIADLDEVIRLQPDNAEAFNSRCWARVTNDVELDLARRDCDEAIRLSNRNFNHLDSRAMVSLKLGNFTEAIALYDEALRARPATARFLYGRGVAYTRLGELSKAKADIDEALRIDSSVGEMYRRYAIVP
jgi:tetratricopeptide (TPR) repeat protein